MPIVCKPKLVFLFPFLFFFSIQPVFRFLCAKGHFGSSRNYVLFCAFLLSLFFCFLAGLVLSLQAASWQGCQRPSSLQQEDRTQ